MTDDVLEHVTAHVHVDGAEWVVKEVDIGVLIHGSSQTDSQLLTAAQTDALRERNINTLMHGSSQTDSQLLTTAQTDAMRDIYSNSLPNTRDGRIYLFYRDIWLSLLGTNLLHYLLRHTHVNF